MKKLLVLSMIITGTIIGIGGMIPVMANHGTDEPIVVTNTAPTGTLSFGSGEPYSEIGYTENRDNPGCTMFSASGDTIFKTTSIETNEMVIGSVADQPNREYSNYQGVTTCKEVTNNYVLEEDKIVYDSENNPIGSGTLCKAYVVSKINDSGEYEFTEHYTENWTQTIVENTNLLQCKFY